jgi:hypothetical protein
MDLTQFSALTSALQQAVLLARRQESAAQESAREASDLRSAVERAAVAARQLRTEGGDR